MEGTVAQAARPSAAHDVTARNASTRSARYASQAERQNDQKSSPASSSAHAATAPATGRTNPTSPDAISTLLVSLGSISDQSEQLFDRLLPAQTQERPLRQSRSRRNPSNSRPSQDAPPPVPTLVRGQVAPEEKSQPGSSSDQRQQQQQQQSQIGSASRPERKSDTVDGVRLPAVPEIISPTTGQPIMPQQASVVASRRPNLGSHPPPVDIPNSRTMSLRSGHQANDNDGRETFASISITPGKTANESITSADSGGKRLTGLSRSTSKAKSSKSKIRELDAAEKKRRRGKTGKTPMTPKSATSENTPGIPSPGLPPPGLLADEGMPSPLKNGFHAARSRNNVANVADAPGSMDPEGLMPEIGPSDLSKSNKRFSHPRPSYSNGGGGIAIPPRGSSRQSMDAARLSRTSSPARSRAGSRATSRATSRAARHRPSTSNGDVPKLPVERDEDDTKKRIEQLQKAKEERKEQEAKLLATLRDAPRPLQADILMNGAVTHLPPPSDKSDKGGRKKSMAEERSQKRTKSVLSGAGSETRDSFQMPRSYSQPTFTARPRDLDVLSTTDSIDEAVEAYVGDPRLSQTIYHPQTKRCISYSDVGDPDGAVIVCCVGMGTTRYVTAFFDELARMHGLRLITPERPGIADSEPYGPTEMDAPLGWPDDVRLICQHLNIKRFMLLAHSAGAIYALATALRMPSEIRGRVHILAPWIPPSQLQSIGLNEEPVPVAELPLIQRILRAIPEPLLEAATRIFNMSSITSSLGKSPYAKRRARRNTTGGGEKRRVETPGLTLPSDEAAAAAAAATTAAAAATTADGEDGGGIAQHMDGLRSTASSPTPKTDGLTSPENARPGSSRLRETPSAMDLNAAKFDEAIAELTEEDRENELNLRMAATIWNLATSNANPAIDLMVCLERKQEIGFRYEDITKPVVMHHGTKDTRVSVENVVWIGDKMRRCEVRVLEGEGHGLMASPTVMSRVLEEMAQDWQNWEAVVKGRRG